MFNVLNPEAIKGALREENTYGAIVPSILSSPGYSEQINGQLPLKDPGIKAAAEKAFPAADFEAKTGTAVDGTFNWLEGKSENPEFQLDFTHNKQQLGTEIGNYTEERLKSLPRCTLSNLPDTFDPYTINCLPPGFSASGLAATVSQQIRQDENFLKDPVITSANLRQNQDPFAPLGNLKPLYENQSLILIALPLLIILLAIIGFLMSPDRLKALRRLTGSFVAAAVLLVILALIMGFGTERLVTAFAADAFSRDLLGPVATNLAGKARDLYLFYAAIAAVIGVALYVLRRKLT